MAERKILVVEDDAKHRAMLSTLLKERGYETIEAENGQQAVKACAGAASPELVLMDCRMPVMSGQEALSQIRRLRPELPVIMMTAYSEISDAVEAIRHGAFDYLAKPLNIENLEIAIANALAQGRHSRENLIQAPASGTELLLGEDEAIINVKKLIEAAAPTDAITLITGESGTGKELAARSLHLKSHRAAGPFVAINCGAFTESLLDSELFGYEKGAFTGADRKRDGLFMEAGGGTLFLDEIGEMPLSMQVKLLRVLQEREVLSVGAQKPRPLNCRIIAATNRDLLKEVKEGRFREDLYYRLNVLAIEMPPLRSRPRDIPLLAAHFARKFGEAYGRKVSGIDKEAMEFLKAHSWPGNARELSNVMERAVVLLAGDLILSRFLPESLRAASDSGVSRERDSGAGQKAQGQTSLAAPFDQPLPTLDDIEKEAILKTLKRFGDNKTDAAKALGISRKTLYAKLSRYGEAGGEDGG